jgi:hypothetical protein
MMIDGGSSLPLPLRSRMHIKHMQINGYSDEFLNVHGQDAIMYSRITQVFKTRIDYVLSKTIKCSYFQYIDMNLGLDHSAMFVRFDISLSIEKEFISSDIFFSGWVISKCLENDDLFLNKCKSVIKDEFDSNNNIVLDPSFFWLKLKTVLKGFYFSILIVFKSWIL